MDKENLWKSVLSELELTLTKGTFQTFFKDTFLAKINHNVATIACPSSYIRTLIESRYYSLLKQALDRLTKSNNSLIFTMGKGGGEKKTQALGPLFTPTEPQASEATRRAHLKPDFTFKNFVVSSSNQMAYAAAQAVAE